MNKLFSLFYISLTALGLLVANTVVASDTQDYVADLDYLYRMGKEVYCYWDNKREMYGVDWDVLYKRAGQKMQKAKSPQESYGILREMVSAVKDGHVNIWMDSPELLLPYYMPLKFTDVGGKVIVSRVKESAFWGVPPVQPGDEILAIDGKKIGERMAFLSHYCSGSTPRMVRRCALAWLNSLMPFESLPDRNPLLLLRKAGTGKTIQTEVPWLIYESAQDPTFKEEAWSIQEDVEAKIFPGNIGYLRVGAMADRDPERRDSRRLINYIENLFPKLLKTKGLIIDVRGNGGGSGSTGDAILSHLIDKPTIRYKASPRLSMVTLFQRPSFFEYEPDPAEQGRFSKWKEIIIEPASANLRYHGKVVVLIDSRCFSACDTFADSVASNGLAVMMGEPTGGGTGYPLGFFLPSGMNVRFSTLRGMSNFGHLLEGIGTVPQISARLSVEDITEERDSVLMRAHALLLSGTHLGKSFETGGFTPAIPLRGEPIEPAFVTEKALISATAREGED